MSEIKYEIIKIIAILSKSARWAKVSPYQEEKFWH